MSLSFFARAAAVCGCIALGAASSSTVQGQCNLEPLLTEYPVAGSLPGDQVRPCAAIGLMGGYLVWQDNSVTPFGARIKAARLDSGLESGSNFIVSSVYKSKNTGDQQNPQVALLANGGAAIVWQQRNAKKGGSLVYARFLDANGAFKTKDVLVSKAKKNYQIEPQVAALADGSVVIVWSSDGQDGSMKGVFARRFSAVGAALGLEFQVNQHTLQNQRSPALAPLPGGGFVAVWVSELQRTPSSVDVVARIFDAAGAAVSGEFQVSASANVSCANPAVGVSPQGGFMVAWSQNDYRIVPTAPLSHANNVNGIPLLDQNGNPLASGALPPPVRSTNSWDVFARVYDAGASPVTGPFRMNQHTYGDQFAPKVGAAGACYAAVWNSLSQPDPVTGMLDDSDGVRKDPIEGVFGQVFSSSGAPGSDQDLHVNTTTIGRQIQPAIASDGVDRFLATWASLVSNPASPSYGSVDLFGQRLQLTP